MTSSRLALTLCLVVAAGGCVGDIVTGDPVDPTDPGPGPGSDPGPDPMPMPTPPLTATGYLHQYNVNHCDEAFACMASYPVDPSGMATFALMYGATPAACYDMMDLASKPAQVEESIVGGRIVFNVTSATSCLSGMAAGACATFFTPGPTYPTTCIEALKGLVPDGEACVTDYDCLNDDSTCDITNAICVANGNQ